MPILALNNNHSLIFPTLKQKKVRIRSIKIQGGGGEEGNIPKFHAIQTLATTLTSNECCGVDKHFRFAQCRLNSIIGPRAKQYTVEISRSENHIYFH